MSRRCFGNPVYVASIPSVVETFHVGTTLAISPVSFYALGLCVGPIIASSVSELFGRRIIFLVSLPLFLAFLVVSGSAHNFATLAVSRFLTSLAGSPSITTTIGVLNDVWDMETEKNRHYLPCFVCSYDGMGS
jgi:MFS family permease